MEVELSKKAERALLLFDNALQMRFLKHFEKVKSLPPRRHLRLGLPYFVEEVSGQARFTYVIEEKRIIVTECFATHKEYEKWFRTYKI